MKGFVIGLLAGLLVAYAFFFFILPSGNPPEVDIDNLRMFLATDPTDLRRESGWTCIDYAITLRENAKKTGIPLGFVVVNIKFFGGEHGHALNCAMLKNNTIVFIEPQTDDIDVDLRRLLEKCLKERIIKVEKVGIVW